MNPDSGYLCRCECVTAAEVQAAIDEGNLTINDIKRRTKAGMGVCQGIFCLDQIAQRLIDHGIVAGSIEPMTARPPTRSITLAAVASSERDE